MALSINPSYPQQQSSFQPGSPSHFSYQATSGFQGTSNYQTTSGPSMYTTQSAKQYPEGVEHERRHVQSVVLNEEYLSNQAEDTVTYVEVPYIEEVIRHVPRKEIVEVEKKVPKYEIEYIDRVVEIPQIQYIDKTVEVPQVHEVLRHVPRREVVEVPKEIIKHVPRVETKVVEKVVEVMGERIEVPKPYTVENKITVPQYVDKEVPMIVAQTVKPVITEAKEHLDVDVFEYEPEVIPVDIHVPKAMSTQLIAKGVVDEVHRLVQVPAAQYNSMLRLLNPHIAEKDSSALPFINQSGKVPFLGTGEPIPQTAPISSAEIMGWSGYSHHMRNVSAAAYHQMTTQRSHSLGGRISGSHRSQSSMKDMSHRQYSQNQHIHGGIPTSTRRTARRTRGGCPC